MTPEQRAKARHNYRKWYAAHKDDQERKAKKKRYDRMYREKHPLTREQKEQRRARWQKWYAEKKAEKQAYNRRYYAEKVKDEPMIELTTQLSLMPEIVEPEVQLISVDDVRREEGLDRPRTAHVCHFYPPSFRCICGKQQEQPPMVVRARSVFVPFEQEGVRV